MSFAGHSSVNGHILIHERLKPPRCRVAMIYSSPLEFNMENTVTVVVIIGDHLPEPFRDPLRSVQSTQIAYNSEGENVEEEMGPRIFR